MEGAIWNFYNQGKILKYLFKILILAEKYNKEWRNLEKII